MDEEGLTATENQRIHIGRPIEFDENTFFDRLEKLYEAADREHPDMKELVAQFVPTYTI